MKACPDLKTVIDLTATARYYKPEDLEERGIQHVKISAGGGGQVGARYIDFPKFLFQVPSEDVVGRFFQAVDNFLDNRIDENDLLGVHCTHGLNRSI